MGDNLSLNSLRLGKLDANKQSVDALRIDSATVNGFSVEKSVPANAKFTDTVYTHPNTHPSDMITGLANVATTGQYRDLLGKPANLPANGGNADTVGMCNIDDNTISHTNIWTAYKTNEQIKNVIRSFKTIEERDNCPEDELIVGNTYYVINDGVPYYYKGNRKWREITSNATVHTSATPPDDTSMVWINNTDEQIETSFGSTLLDEFKSTIREIQKKINDMHYALTYELDGGFFGGKKPGSNDEIINPDDPVTNMPDGAEGNVKHICIKRGWKQDFEPLFDGEFGYCTDTKELFIGNNGKFDLIGSVGGGGNGNSGSGNITAEYIELISPNKTAYRITVSDLGELMVYDAALDNAPDPKPGEEGRFKGLIINQIYGGGARNSDATSVSHGFIELYNGTPNDINLKGLSIQYGENLKPWNCLPLKGLIPAYCSFLIRCAQHSNPNLSNVRVNVNKADMNWDIPLTDKGMKVYLGIGKEAIGIPNPFNSDGLGNPLPGYIDMLSCGGEDVTRVIDGYEKRFLHLMNKDTAVHRKDFADTNDNSLDVEAIDYRNADVAIYGPRCVKDGQWNIYYNKIKLDPDRPNMINICFGEDANTTRTFTWQSIPTTKGYLMYKKKGDEQFISVPTTKRPVQHHDTDGTIHSVIIKNLTPGTYVYKAGEEGKWSEEYEFVVKDFNDNTPFTFLHVTDQQGWNEYEYKTWEVAMRAINEFETYDFIINTGDISQNANRAFEWRYYYEFAKQSLSTKVHMLTCGNNDLIDKKDSTAFTYYSTFENSPYTSVHSYNVGMVHFICLNSNELITEQIEWLKQDMTNNDKRCTIVYMHVSPYTIVRTAKVQPFAPVFEELGVDLVICGHNHTYSRSHPMYQEQIDEQNGVYYVMSQATGYKLSGKEKPTNPWPLWYAHQESPGQPSYIMWEVSYDKIVMKSYRLDNVKPTELNGIPQRSLFDTVEILHK